MRYVVTHLSLGGIDRIDIVEATGGGRPPQRSVDTSARTARRSLDSVADGIQRLPQRQVNETVSELICSQAGETEFSILNHSADGCALRRKQHSTDGCTSM
jgi:hypothetical protein